MIPKFIKKLFDPNYATKQVTEISKETEEKLRGVSEIANEYKRIAKKGDVSMIIRIAAGGKPNGN